MRVIELRNYLIRDGTTRDFIRYFEEHFLFSQRDKGMHVLGQFEAVDDPNRFVWIRGFEDMAARLRGLSDFYGGPFWQARRSEVNAMILELRRRAPAAAARTQPHLAGGLSLEDRASAPPGAVPPHTGLVAVDFHRAEPGGARPPGRALRAARATRPPRARPPRARPLRGLRLAPNDYPRLPVRQDPDSPPGPVRVRRLPALREVAPRSPPSRRAPSAGSWPVESRPCSCGRPPGR